MSITSNYIYRRAKKHFEEEISSCCLNYNTTINAIKIVDGLSVNAEFNIVKKCDESDEYRYIFSLESKKIYKRNYDCRENYWTEWQDESQYILFNNQLIQI